MQRVRLESSVLASALYFPKEQVLELEFRSGAIYRYFGFPERQYGEFLAADSKGTYFNRSIRDQYPYQQIRDAAYHFAY
jgi:hypothetical protein